MQSKSLTIGVLSITAVLLLIAQFVDLQPAMAGESVKDRDYSLVTATSQQGGEIVYVIDNHTGQVAVFAWDAGRRGLQFRGAGSMADAFR